MFIRFLENHKINNFILTSHLLIVLQQVSISFSQSSLIEMEIIYKTYLKTLAPNNIVDIFHNNSTIVYYEQIMIYESYHSLNTYNSTQFICFYFMSENA